MHSIVNGMVGGQRAGAHRGAPRHGAAGHETATIRPRDLRYDAQCPRLGAGSRYNNCIVAERGATLCHGIMQPGAEIWRSAPCDTSQGYYDTRGSA